MLLNILRCIFLIPTLNLPPHNDITHNLIHNNTLILLREDQLQVQCLISAVVLEGSLSNPRLIVDLRKGRDELFALSAIVVVVEIQLGYVALVCL